MNWLKKVMYLHDTDEQYLKGGYSSAFKTIRDYQGHLVQNFAIQHAMYLKFSPEEKRKYQFAYIHTV